MFPSLLFFLALALPSANTSRVEIRDSEVWLTRDGHTLQLTHDGKPKLLPQLSSAQDRVAYYQQCPPKDNCDPSLIILTLNGNLSESFDLPPEGSPCTSILALDWTGPNSVSLVCHINPSLNEYFEMDLFTKEIFRDLLGYDFTRSPDGKTVAHVGSVRHFAPPYDQSNYLQLDDTTVYPLPKGAAPKKQLDPDQQPYVVPNNGLHYFGIHGFLHGLAWSPDSRRVALIDCIYDWTRSGAESTPGVESNRRCSLVVVSPNGSVQQFPLTDISPLDLRSSHLEWSQQAEIILHLAGAARRIPLQ